MYVHVEKTKQKTNQMKQRFGFVDNRTKAIDKSNLCGKIGRNTTIMQLATEAKACYKNLTDNTEILKQITKNHLKPDESEDVLQQISNICWETDIKPDYMSHWMQLLNTHVCRAVKWGGEKDVIELYPSGTKGDGKHDRFWLHVSANSVAIKKAYKSEH